MSTSTDLVNVAIIGAGSAVAPRHFESFIPSVGARVVAGVEPDNTRRRQLSDQPLTAGIPMFETMKALREANTRVDLAVVCVPDAYHAEVAGSALVDHRWHVLCEKPLADDFTKAQTLYRLAGEQGLYLGHALQRQYMTPEIDALVAQGALGEIRRVDVRWHRFGGAPAWRRLLQGRGGVLADLGAHAFKHAFRLFEPERPVRIWAQATHTTPNVGIEDEAFVVVQFPTERLMTTDLAFDRLVGPRRQDRASLYVGGTEGEITAELLTNETTEQAARKQPVLRTRARSGNPKSTLLQPLRTTSECHLEQARRTVAAVRRGGAAPREEVWRELELLRLIDLAYKSAETGDWITFRQT